MIQLRFTTSEEAFDLPSPPEQEDPAVLMATAFEMPVFFFVNDVNLLGFPNGSTAQLAVVGFAVCTREAVERLKPGGLERVPIGSLGTLFLQEVEGTVKCWTTTLPAHAEAPLAELHTALNTFSTEVARVILSRFPNIQRHPYWLRWFPMLRGGQSYVAR